MLNPLLIKELRMKTRGVEAYAVGVIYIFALSALAFGLFWEASSGGRTLDPEYGIKMFLAFVVAVILAVCLICPAFTVGAVSSERERLTFDQLRVTLLKPRQILLGKALPPVIYVLVLIVASIPAASLIAPVGGISPAEMFFCYATAFISAMAFGLVGLMCSSIYRRTRPSIVMTYSIAGFFLFGTAVIPRIVRLNRVLLDLCLSMNPFYAAMSALGRGKQVQIAGLSSWDIAVIGYLIISAVSACITLLRFRGNENG
jgi:ABC-2 type transport system permease protein